MINGLPWQAQMEFHQVRRDQTESRNRTLEMRLRKLPSQVGINEKAGVPGIRQCFRELVSTLNSRVQVGHRIENEGGLIANADLSRHFRIFQRKGAKLPTSRKLRGPRPWQKLKINPANIIRPEKLPYSSHFG